MPDPDRSRLMPRIGLRADQLSKHEPTAIGARVRRLRRQRGWSQQQLADAAEVQRAYLGNVETGRLRHPSGEALAALATALDVSIDYLLTGATAPDGRVRVAVPADIAPSLRALAKYPPPLVRYALTVLRALPSQESADNPDVAM